MEFIGAKQASVVLYLDNKPLLNREENHGSNKDFAVKGLDVEQLIIDNGNHWRKIMTIFAKLCYKNLDSVEDWRMYRDQRLLKQHEQIRFSDHISTTAAVHFFSGKSCWHRFNMTEEQLHMMDKTECGKVYYRVDQTLGLLLYTPYFDYRQFPNRLIEEVSDIIAKQHY